MRGDGAARGEPDAGASGRPFAGGALPARLPIGGRPRPARTVRVAAPPVQGPLTPGEQVELRLLLERVEAAGGPACASYKEPCLRRRIAVRMRACGVHDLFAYRALVERSAHELERLTAVITINVSRFRRDPEVWDALAEHVVPRLAAMDGPLELWSAGTAAGEEAYSLAMLVEETAACLAPERCRILGTDIDGAVLAAAEGGAYAAHALRDLDEARRRRWFGAGERATLHPALRRRVRFQRLDLLRDPLPERQHLILCRNVLIYFERAAQEALLARLHGALAPGGYLVLGKVEVPGGTAASLFQPVVPGKRIYRRA